MSVLLFTALVLCLLIPAGECQQFTIIVIDSQINVTAGGEAFFSVRPSSNVSSGSWNFNGKTIAQWIGQSEILDNDYKSRTELFTSNGSLLLKSVSASDDGVYRVNMVPTSGSQPSATVTLNVIDQVPTNSPPGSSGSLSGGAIAGIVIGVIAGVVLACGLAYCIIKTKTSRLNTGFGKSDPKGTSPENIPSSQTEYAEIERKKPSQPKPAPSSNGANAAPAQAKDEDVIYTRPNIINPGTKPTSEAMVDNKTDYAEVKYR